MATNTYTAGTLVRVSFSFYDNTQSPPVLTDPTTVKMSWSVAGGGPTEWTYGGTGSIVKDSTGKYHADLDTTNQPGVWLWAVEGTGTLQAAGTSSFNVTSIPFRMP